MLMNTLDADVAERPEEMIVCGTAGRPVANFESYVAIATALKTLESDQTLLVQSGKPAGIVRTGASAPRVLISGDTAAESWIYVGTQGELEDTYEAFRVLAEGLFGGTLAGRLVVSAGMGSVGGAQPLAAQLNGAAFLGIDADSARIKRRVKGGYCDVMVSSLDEALRILKNAVRQRAARSVGLVGNAADVMTELSQRGVVPGLLTDRTSAHDPLLGYWPQGLSLAEASEMRRTNADEARRRTIESIVTQVRSMLALRKLGAFIFDFGNEIFARAQEAGVAEAATIPKFADAGFANALAETRAPMRWIALSGEAADINRIDRLVLKMFPDDETLGRWIPLAQKYVRAQGLPARVCWMRRGDRARFGAAVNNLVARGELKWPIVLGRDFRDCGIAESTTDEPILVTGDAAVSPQTQAMLDATSGASWAAISSRGGVARVGPQFAQAIVADGKAETGARIELVMSR
jgi:urocanate hydratase